MSAQKTLRRLSKETKMLCAIFVLVMLVIGLAALSTYLFLTHDTQKRDADSLREEIIPVAKLATYEYQFTEILFLDDSNMPIDLPNPITSTRYVATIEGSAMLYVDVDNLSCDSVHNRDGSIREVKVSLPHCKPGDIYLDHNSLKTYVDDGGFMGMAKIESEEMNGLFTEAQAKQQEKLASSDYVEKADKRAQDLITAQIQGIHGEEVKVTFEYVED